MRILAPEPLTLPTLPQLPLLATCRLLQLVLDAERRLAGRSQRTEE